MGTNDKFILHLDPLLNTCCDGRVVKALDSKSNGIFPHRFEPCSQRSSLLRLKYVIFFLPKISLFSSFFVSGAGTAGVMVSFKIPILETWVRFPGSAKKTFIFSLKKLDLCHQKIHTFQGAPRFELGTSRSAVECSTTELYPHVHTCPNFTLKFRVGSQLFSIPKYTSGSTQI